MCLYVVALVHSGHCTCPNPSCKTSQDVLICPLPSLNSFGPTSGGGNSGSSNCTAPNPPPPAPAVLRKADGSCAVMPNSHWDLVVATAPVHENSEWVAPGSTAFSLATITGSSRPRLCSQPCSSSACFVDDLLWTLPANAGVYAINTIDGSVRQFASTLHHGGVSMPSHLAMHGQHLNEATQTPWHSVSSFGLCPAHPVVNI